MYQGKRIDNAEYFDDQMEGVGGLFEGSQGLTDQEGIKQSISDAGQVVDMNCRLCGKKHKVTLEWEEMYVVGSNTPGMPAAPAAGDGSTARTTEQLLSSCAAATATTLGLPFISRPKRRGKT